MAYDTAAEPKPAIHDKLSPQELATIGADVVRDWQTDLQDNKEWREAAEKAEAVAAQVGMETKDYPFTNASNVKYPLLTIAALAFHGRAYPAIVKGDEAVKVKTFGKDRDGKKQERAKRMAEYLNYQLFYRVDGWEEDTDSFLLRLPIVGQHFRKVYRDPLTGRDCVESISALRLTIPPTASSLKRAPRITHDFDRYPHELQSLMRAGHFRKVELPAQTEDEQAPRVILEQYRMIDLDDDGLDEPYIVTVDQPTGEVLRVEEGWISDEDVTFGADNKPIRIERFNPFVSYTFIPDMKGRAYGIGFGHLLTAIMDVVNTNINLMIDAGHAQVAGGGFISAEVRLQTQGKGSRLKWQPGEYKTVNAQAGDLRAAIYERTLPEPSPVLFQLLGLLMEAAKDIASVNDAITGDAARSAPVGTTLALIEQGQQVFNAIYKRIYRALREEFRLFADCQRKYGDPAEYARFCDIEPAPADLPQPDAEGGAAVSADMAAPPVDPMKLFDDDFNAEDLDVCPVSDPTAVTRMQAIAKAQFVLSLVPTGQVDPQEAVRSALEAGSIDNIDALMKKPTGPDPVQLQMMALDAQLKDSQGKKAEAEAQLATAKAAEIAHQNTGPQADVDLAGKAAVAHKQQAEAFAIAANTLTPEMAHQMDGE